MALSKGDIVLVPFPFTDFSQTKLRPALVLHTDSAKNEITLCFITSQNVNDIDSNEFLLDDTSPDFAGTGLKLSSKVRVSRMITVSQQLIQRRLGKLSTEQIQQLSTILLKVLNLN
jgi:mRNA interferase MazF